MTRQRGLAHRKLTHRFVQYVPERLEPGVLYIALEFGSVSHSCCCGCGEEVVTPLTPTDWRMTYDGEAVSLHPSVGRWYSACRSHYVVDRGRVIECGSWSDDEVAAERRRDRAAKARHYSVNPQSVLGAPEPLAPRNVVNPPLVSPPPRSTWQRVTGWLARRPRRR